MPASSSTMFVCAGLVLGALGVGGLYLTDRDTSAKVTNAKPLFARSVEAGGVPPAGRWPEVRLDVPYYGPMVELLTFGGSAGRTATADPSSQRPPEAAPRASREAAEARKQQKQARRPKDRRPNDEATAEPNARDAYARDVPERSQRGRSMQRRNDEEDANRATRRSRNRQLEVDEATDRRRPEDRRQAPRDRSFTREDRRDQERRESRVPEGRDAGFAPFRMFGGFDQR
jgi:hypothetical protein